MSISQVSDKITQLLADGYLVNPQVNVFVKEFRSKKVVVLGRVRSPGLIELSGPISFLELISKAGGLEKDAGDTATVKRKENGKDAVIVVDLISLLEGGDLTQNVSINDGDTVVIAKSGMCYVTGEVEEPGSYPCASERTFSNTPRKRSKETIHFVAHLMKNDLDDTLLNSRMGNEK